MVMLQSPVKSSDNSQNIAAGNQMSPNSNPGSPKSNTSPDYSSNNTTVASESTTKQVSKFNNNNNNSNNSIIKNDDGGIIYSIERLKQMTESGILSPSTEEADGDLDVKKCHTKSICTQSSTTTSDVSTISSSVNFCNMQQRKLMELSKLARPEPLSALQHPHAVLLQQHPHLLHHQQFLVAAAAQQQQQQQQHQNIIQQHHAHQNTPAAFQLRTPTMSTLPPSPANSPLSPPTSPTPATQSQTNDAGQTNSLSPSQQHSLQQQLLSSPSPSSMLINSQQHAALAASSPPTTGFISTATSSANDMDIERFKLVAAQAVASRTHSSNVMPGLPLQPISTLGAPPTRADLSDYGFRIQLGGLAAAAAAAAATSRQIAAANYTRSDTSEELNVDGNDEDSNECSNGTPSVCPVDLTRSVPTTTSTSTKCASTTSNSTNSENEPTKRLAFSVENILDPNKFNGKRLNGDSRPWDSNSSNCDRDEDLRDRLDDEHSDDMSGKSNI